MSPDQYFLTDGIRLRYRDEGAGPGVVFVHGWTLDLNMWDPQADALKHHFRVVRFDRRGFGLSSGRPDLLQDVADVIELCRYLSVRPVGCVGMSQGARVALRLAATAPQLAACLVLDGPPHVSPSPETLPDDVNLPQLRELARTEGMEAFRRQWAGHPLTSLATADPIPRELVDEMIARYPGADLLADSATQVPTAPAFTLDAIAQPVLVLNGASDTPTRLRAGQALAQSLPRGTRAIVPAARHLANLDNPAVYNSLLLRFFLLHL
jgi:pimeloyl-ACP methyl ester carboxylesterase